MTEPVLCDESLDGQPCVLGDHEGYHERSDGVSWAYTTEGEVLRSDDPTLPRAQERRSAIQRIRDRLGHYDGGEQQRYANLEQERQDYRDR